MMNHEFTGNWIYGKMVLPGVTGGKNTSSVTPFSVLFSVVSSPKNKTEMTCNPFRTELTSTTNKRNDLSILPLVVVDWLSPPLRTRKELTLSSKVAGTGTNRLEARTGGRELQKRENLLYVGIDLHKERHTAVMVNLRDM